MPYIATFLPPRDEMFQDGDLNDENWERANFCPTDIQLKDNPTRDEVAAALDALERLAPSIRWQTNYEMYASHGEGSEPTHWMGITRLIDTERPWGAARPEEIVAADDVSMRNKLVHRPLIIAIMGEYVDAIRNSPPSSEQRLRAIFMAGVTMAHEVGHAIFHQDFKSYNPPVLTEPYVGNGTCMELGVAFITWIFNGSHPNSRELPGRVFVDFTAHLGWVEHYTMDIPRPLYKTEYSISMRYIQEKLTQGWWDRLSTADILNFSSKAKEGLKPITDPTSNETATARTPEWLYSWPAGGPQWKSDMNYRKKGYRSGDNVEGLSEAEIEWQKSRQPKRNSDDLWAHMSLSELKKNRMLGMFRREDFSDSEKEEEELQFLKLKRGEDADVSELDIEDGLIEKDVIPPLEDDTTALTRIVVRYLLDDDSSAKRRRNNNSHHARSTKRVKLELEDNDHSGIGDRQVKTEADRFLKASSPFTIASTMTRIDIHNLCVSRKIPGYHTLGPTEGWQQGHPDLDDPTDKFVVQRLYNDMLDTALVHMFKDNRDAKIKLKRASVNSVKDW